MKSEATKQPRKRRGSVQLSDDSRRQKRLDQPGSSRDAVKLPTNGALGNTPSDAHSAW